MSSTLTSQKKTCRITKITPSSCPLGPVTWKTGLFTIYFRSYSVSYSTNVGALIIVFVAISQKPVDVREELKKVGRTNTAEYFNRMQAQRRQAVMEMRQKGIVGAMTSIEKMNKEDTAPRMTREKMEQNKILFGSK